jgi:hypothetical protein
MHAIRFAAAFLVLAATAAAQTTEPATINGTVSRHAVSGTLEREFATLTRGTTRAMWIGYSVATRPSGGSNGCWDRRGAGAGPVVPVKLEGVAELYVLYRVEDGMVGKIQIASPECPLDLGGLTMHWLSNVTAAASLDWLATFATGTAPRRLAGNAVLATALHGDASVVERLITMARDGRDRGVRSSALFWLSQRAGERAAGVITSAIDNDPDTQVKRQAVFALSQLPRDQGVPRLIDVARTNKNPEVRRQAMFWLGQSQDPRALAFFEEILRGR